MAEQFYTIPTAIGKAKIANSIALGTKVNLTTMKVGDSNGSYYNPTESQTDLVNTVYSCNVTSVEIDETNSNWINVICAIPADVGGFFVREAGIFDDSGNLIVIGKYPETYKPIAANGSTKELYIKMTFEVTNASSVELKIDPTVILATKTDINILTNSIASINSQLSEKANNTDVLLNDNTEDIYLASFFNDINNSNIAYLYTTNDCISFRKIGAVGTTALRDTDIIFYNGTFYCLATQSGTLDHDFILLTSTNLTDWNEQKINVGLTSTDLPYVWAPDWFFDTDGKIYITISKQIGTMTDSSNSQTYSSFRPYIFEVTDLENLKFSTPRQLNLDNTNKIDCHIVKKDSTYYLFIKKERNESGKINGNIEIWTSTDLITWTNFTYAIPGLVGYTFEGCMIALIDNVYYLYLDNYNGDYGSNIMYCTSNNLEAWSSPLSIQTINLTRHGSVRKVTNIQAKKIIYNKINENIAASNLESSFTYNKCRRVCANTSFFANKYIKMLTIQAPGTYKSMTMLFNITDTQNNFINIDFKLSISKGASNSAITTTLQAINIYSSSKDYVSVVNDGNGNIYLMFKIGTFASCAPTISILSVNNFGFILTETEDILSSLPTGTEITCTSATANDSINTAIATLKSNLRLSKQYTASSGTSITANFYSTNGIVKIQGHANGYTESAMIDYSLILLNGNIGLVKLDTNGATITVVKNSYSNGVYNITITVPAQYSIVDITLPVGSYFN